MSLHKKSGAARGAYTQNGAETATTPTARNIGFGSTLGLLGATRGSEYTNAIAKVMQEMYANLPAQPKINIFDRERMPNLAYSCIVVSLPVNTTEGEDVFYHVVLLESTGAEPMKASDIVSAAASMMRDPSHQGRIYTTDDAINGKLHNIICSELAVSYPKANLVSTDGVVVHTNTLEVQDLAMRLAAIAYNAVHTESKLASGEVADLNLREAISESGRSMFKLESNLYHTTVANLIGSPVRQDFKIDLVEVEQGNNFELNADTRRHLVSVAGYIDAIREDIAIPVQPGFPAVSTARLHPNIIIANNDTVTPTQGFMSLGMAAATVMARPEMWLQSLGSIDAKSPNSPGSLNIITNIENSQSGAGVALDFSPKTVTTDEHYATLKQMYSMSPIISCDVESYGPQSYYSSVLAAAAAPETNSPNSAQSRQDAKYEIIETCAQLTNGNFPVDFNINDIFATTGIVVPLGYWMDKTGERDIRDVDMAFVAKQTNDVNTINKWGMTALPRNITGLDPFLTKVEIISQMIPDAVINGKAVRVTFTNKFISTLTNAIEAAGLVARYESNLVVNERYDTAQFTDYLATAGMSNASGFAQQYANAGNNMYTGYSNMGRNRF